MRHTGAKLSYSAPTKNILLNAVCPGYCDTDLTSHLGPRSAELGARTLANLALLGADGPNGKFLYDYAELAKIFTLFCGFCHYSKTNGD